MTKLSEHMRIAREMDPLADWRDDAACEGLSSLMDPPPGLDYPGREQDAVRLCYGCPVFADCRRWALGLVDSQDPGGVCGGLTEPQRMRRRRQLRGRRAAAKAAG